MRGADDGVSVTQWFAICNAFDCTCAYCGDSLVQEGIEIEVEHIVALINGGRHAPWNVAPSCRPCNALKKDKPVDVFLEVRGLDPAPVAERFALALQRLGEAA